jgi:hypothetical protein
MKALVYHGPGQRACERLWIRDVTGPSTRSDAFATKELMRWPPRLRSDARAASTRRDDRGLRHVRRPSDHERAEGRRSALIRAHLTAGKKAVAATA